MAFSPDVDFTEQIQRHWRSGRVLSALARAAIAGFPTALGASVAPDAPQGVATGEGNGFEPLRLKLSRPTAEDLARHTAAVATWAARVNASPFRVVKAVYNHRLLGPQSLPNEAWCDTLDLYLQTAKSAQADVRVGGRNDAKSQYAAFAAMVEQTAHAEPLLVPWLADNPWRALALAEHWPGILRFVARMRTLAPQTLYLRQLDIPGLHTKVLETIHADLARILAAARPEQTLFESPEGVGGLQAFCARHGFKVAPVMVRCRPLDPKMEFFPGLDSTGGDADSDLSLKPSMLARCGAGVERVLIVENFTTYLALPALHGTLAIFGAGYGFRWTRDVPWLAHKPVLYWGDLDSHGFAILNGLRHHLPQTRSVLMDRETLEAHRPLWVAESDVVRGELPLLTAEEQSVFQQVRLGKVRLEQEYIGYDWVWQWLISE